jgi:cell division initiation protein
MKISPTAIRQKAFETSFRGYEKKQVTDFLEEMSVVMEQINQENLELRSRLQQVEGEAKRLKDVEDSLFRTLKTAEDTGAAIITEATEAADQIIAEANQIAEETTKQAQRYAEELGSYSAEQARIITTAAEESAKETMRSLTENIKGLIKSYEGLVEQREALVKSLRRLSQDALNQIDLSETHFARIDAKAYQRAVEELSRTNHFSAANSATLTTTANSSSVQREEVSAELPQAEPQADNNEEQVASIDSEEFIETEVESAVENASLAEEDLDAAIFDDQEEELEESSVEAAQEEEFEEEEEVFEEEEVNEEELAVEDLEEHEEELEEEEEVEESAEFHTEEEIEGPEEAASDTTEQKKEEDKPSSGSFFDQFD